MVSCRTAISIAPSYSIMWRSRTFLLGGQGRTSGLPALIANLQRRTSFASPSLYQLTSPPKPSCGLAGTRPKSVQFMWHGDKNA